MTCLEVPWDFARSSFHLSFLILILQMYSPFLWISYSSFIWPVFSLFSTQTSAHPQRHIFQGVTISTDHEEKGIGTGFHADWLAQRWKTNYSIFQMKTSDVMLSAVKALTDCTLNILAICPIGFCSPQLKPFKDSATCHLRANRLPNAHIWNTRLQYETTPSLFVLTNLFSQTIQRHSSTPQHTHTWTFQLWSFLRREPQAETHLNQLV